jgi:hypothetical protein
VLHPTHQRLPSIIDYRERHDQWLAHRSESPCMLSQSCEAFAQRVHTVNLASSSENPTESHQDVKETCTVVFLECLSLMWSVETKQVQDPRWAPSAWVVGSAGREAPSNYITCQPGSWHCEICRKCCSVCRPRILHDADNTCAGAPKAFCVRKLSLVS